MLLQEGEQDLEKADWIVQTQEPIGNVKQAITFRLSACVADLICADIIYVFSQLERWLDKTQPNGWLNSIS